MRIGPPLPHARRKRRMKWDGFRNDRKKVGPHVGTWTGALKDPAKCLWRGSPTKDPISSVRLHVYVPSNI